MFRRRATKSGFGVQSHRAVFVNMKKVLKTPPLKSQ